MATALLSPVLLSAADKERPNLVFVFADQMRADVLGYAGDTKAITPNIDNFAHDAMNFSSALSVSPVSAPYRSSLFTGKYISSTGMVINEINMNPNHRTLANVLNDNGYNCGYIGKMHLNDTHTRPIKKGPERMGFDHYWAGYSFNHMSYNAFYYTDDENGQEVKVSLKGKYGPEEFTTLACDYMERASKEDKPFAMFLSWNPPHDPWKQGNTDPDCYARFKDTEFSLPENFKEAPDPYMDRYSQEFFDGHTAWKDGFEWRAVRDHKFLYAKYLRDGKEVLFDLKKDPGQMNDVAGNPKYRRTLESYRDRMNVKMAELNDEFKPCTWYRDHWMYKGFSIKEAAHGEFGPLPPMEPMRGQKK